MSLEGWQALKCQQAKGIGICGSERFTEVFTIAWREGQGTATKLAAYKCVDCGAQASTANMIDAVKAHNLQVKIDELKAQQANG